jgi:uncharacterized membrane protein
MDGRQEQSKTPVSAALAGPYGHPFHPILVTIPLGAWVCSLVFDIAARVGSRSLEAGFAAQWLIALGVLGALAAASIGFLDLLAIPPQTKARRTAVIHAALNLTVTGAYTANFFWRTNGDPGQPVGWGPVVLSAISLVGLTASGYLGGKLAYRYGVRVAAEAIQADGFELNQRS